MENKNDLMLNMIANPTFSIGDFATIGFNSDNTSLQSKDFYRSKQSVQEFFQNDEGKFNETDFNNAYNKALANFNLMATSDYTDVIKKQLTYHRNNIMAPIEQRRQGPDFKLVVTPNPDRVTNSLITLGKVGQRTKSRDELAQSNDVLLNPNEVNATGDWSKAKWGKNPHSGFFDYFTDTLVMAQWDEDGTHVDPVTKQEVEHHKGDLKINQNGTYYYEKLDGRDIYGRRVLNKMNVLTEEGSTWNKYDFFDSDDLNQKSKIGTTMKNLALVGTMFIPYVGPVVAGISIATQLAGLGATLGKMLVGSDSPTLSAIEGWSKSVNRQGAVSEYAQEHTWCWENFINLIGDVAGQLKEQRFIFEKIPTALKGSPEKAEKMFTKARQLEVADEQSRLYAKAAARGRGLSMADAKKIQDLQTVATLKAQADYESWMKGYQKIGEVLSKGYMTAITVGDTYGEAKNAGASDLDATLLTLGYAAGEYSLLNTGIGEWILPELRANRFKNKAIIKALTDVDKETQKIRQELGEAISSYSKDAKKEYAKRVFNVGKRWAREELGSGAKTLNATLAAGLGEGVEEVSEEFLADFSKGCYNTVNWLRGNDVRMSSFGFDESGKWNYQELIDRYGMSLVGGAVGGSLTNLGTNYKYFKDYKGMDKQSAIQEIVRMYRNGEIDDLTKEIDKTEWADGKLSYDYEESNGELMWKPGDKLNNRNTVIRNTLKQQISLIGNILDAEGANLSDQSFLDKQVLGDLRFHALFNSVTAGDFIQEFNNLTSEAVKLTNDINRITSTIVDENKDGNISDREVRKAKLSAEDRNIVKQKEDRLKEVRQQIKDLTEGKRADEFVGQALFEMTTFLSDNFVNITFPMWCKAKFGKDYNDIQPDEKNKAREDYKTWLKTEARDKVRDAYKIYRTIAEQSSNTIKNSEQTYLNQAKVVQDMNRSISNLYVVLQELKSNDAWQQIEQNRNNLYNILKALTINIDPTFADKITSEYNAEYEAIDKDTSLDEQQKNEKRKEANRNHAKKLDRFLADNFESFITPYINQGFANVEVKNQLNRIIQLLKHTQEQLSAELADDFLMQGIDPESQPNPYKDKITRINELSDQLNALNNTPFEENINQFAISTGQNPINITDLIKRVNLIFGENARNISNFTLDDPTFTELKNAIFTLNMYRASIIGAKTDNVDTNNLFGFNATLNEVSKKLGKEVNLAEINSEFADVLLADIDNNLNKLEFLKRLYEVNQGQKMNKQGRVGIKANALVYKRMKQIIQVLRDDDNFKNIIDINSFNEFESTINGLKIHNQIQSDITLSPEEKFELEQEKIKFDNAIYKFFNENSILLNDPKALSKFINPKIFDLYTQSNEILNEELEAIDDVSMVWYIAARAAVKASDFYSIYKDILDPQSGIIPIATQEIAIYNNYANVVNGNVFDTFVEAYKQSIKEDWKNRTPKDRSKIFDKLGYNITKYLDPKYNDFCLNFLPYPKYSNIVFTEGIPGAGKSAAVLTMTIKLLEKTNPDLIKNIAYVHGADLDPNTLSTEEKEKKTNADKLKDQLTKTGTAQDKYSFLRRIIKNYTPYAEDKNGNVIVPESGYYITENTNEVRGSCQIVESNENIPSLIVIDEVTKFNNYELDAINDYAKKHGITVIVLGDFDQTGVSGNHEINFNGESISWELTLERNNLIRCPKLGVSMRTDNQTKSRNLARFQEFRNSDHSQTLELNWYEDETGLYGDRVFPGQISDIDSIVTAVKKLIDTLEEGEKIGFIYADGPNETKSALYDALNVSGIREHLDLKPKGTAQGQEGRYYIIDAINIDGSDFSTWSREIYTGMSRASQGSIIITNELKLIKSPIQSLTENLADSFGAEAVTQYVTLKKEMLDQIVQGETPTYNPRNKKDITQVSNDMDKGLPDSEPSTQPATPQQPPTQQQPTQPTQQPEPQQPSQQPTQQQPNVIEDFKNNYQVGDVIEVSGTLFGYNGQVQIKIDTIVDDQIYGTFVKGRTGTVIAKIEDLVNKSISKIKSSPKNMSHQDLIDKYGGYMDTKSFEIEVDGKKDTVILEGIPFENDIEKGISNIVHESNDEYSFVQIKIGDFKGVFKFDNNYPEDGWTLDENKLGVNGSDNNIITQIINKLNETFKNIDLNNSPVINYDQLEELDYYNQYSRKDEINTKITEEFNKLAESNEDPLTPLYDQWMNDILNSPQEQPALEDTLESDNNEKVPTSEEEYKQAIVDSNPTSKDDIRPEDSAILFHSFNTMELGATIVDGEIVFDQFAENRIDGVNGLIKADQIAGKTDEYTVDRCLQRLGLIQSIILNNTEKSDIVSELKNILGINGIYVNFALKARSTITDSTKNNENKDRVRQNGVGNQLARSKNEKTFFNNSKDTRSGETNAHQLVAIIGTRANGEFLEIPIFTMTSPFTYILAKRKEFPELALIIDSHTVNNKLDISIHELAKLLSDEVLNANNPKHRTIRSLLTLFRFNHEGLFRVFDPKNPKKYQDWTIGKFLQNLGPQMTATIRNQSDPKKGILDLLAGMEYDPNLEQNWMTVSEYNKDPRVKITPIMKSLDGVINGKQVLKKGHPFVLISYNYKHKNNQDIVDQFIRQQDPNYSGPIEVIQSYILPPSTSLSDYIETLDKLSYAKREEVKNIKSDYGNLLTPLRLIQVLSQNQTFMNELHARVPGAYNTVFSILSEVNKLGNDNHAIKSYLLDKINWNGDNKVSRATYLGRILTIIGFNKTKVADPRVQNETPTLDTDLINKLQKALDDIGFKIFYWPKLDGERTVGPFRLIQQDYSEDGLSPLYQIDGQDVQINGKIDSYVFKGNIDELLDLFCDKIRYNVELKNSEGDIVAIVDKSKDDYRQYLPPSDTQVRTEPDLEPSDYYKQASAVVNKVSKYFSEVGILFDKLPNNATEQQLNDFLISIVSDINKKASGIIAFKKGNDILLSPELDIFKNYQTINFNRNSYLELTSDNSGKQSFEIGVWYNNGDLVTYTAEYDSIENQLKVTEPVKQRVEPISTIKVTEENFPIYSQALSEVFNLSRYSEEKAKEIDSILNKSDRLLNNVISNIKDYNKFIESILKLRPSRNARRVEFLRSLLIDESTNEQIDIINQLINYEEAIQNKQDLCPITKTLSLI